MPLADFMRRFPAVDIPFPEEVITTNVLRSDDGLAVFFTFHENLDLPAHSHGGQWGTVLQGEIELTVEGETRRYRPGETYTIPSGALHSARIAAGTVVLDVFEEPDRYPLRA
ncbi:cupin domain-containing protein [Defluviimonas salinarum]|uniref:Cupin domain-containing protein n=1 Tax=Defluviimonas salinarum TaxID=2992147 RepID=A0ABT3J098_9RHOB|nr:cupin domain-containing protein [Defluviimonas salinarum]MCW3781107.1 cupin domain-containing protein [Defluviimonas salinarum]